MNNVFRQRELFQEAVEIFPAARSPHLSLLVKVTREVLKEQILLEH